MRRFKPAIHSQVIGIRSRFFKCAVGMRFQCGSDSAAPSFHPFRETGVSEGQAMIPSALMNFELITILTNVLRDHRVSLWKVTEVTGQKVTGMDFDFHGLRQNIEHRWKSAGVGIF